MRLQVSHPDWSAYDHYLLSVTPETEEQINRLGPFSAIATAYDWPDSPRPLHGWTDQVNSLWWPRGPNVFATAVLLIDDSRADLVEACVAAQVGATPTGQAPRPYLILRALLAPAEGDRPAERYEPAGLLADDVTAEVELLAWKLYPLPPVRLTEVDGSDRFPGLWLLPLVDLRYFYRTTPLYPLDGGSSTYAGGGAATWPLIRVDHRATPDWMPPLRAYPDDLTAPLDYEPIVDNGTHPLIAANHSRGKAAEIQARMENWRIVCRDVRSNYNAPEGWTQHTQFTGIVADYPDPADLDLDTQSSYHEDVIRLAEFTGNRIAGGLCDQAIVEDLIARKLSFLFRVALDDHHYNIIIEQANENPLLVSELTEDGDGLGLTERLHVPKVFLGVEAKSREPAGDHRAALVAAAKQWAILYYRWRNRQCYYKFPGLAPLMPNGYAAMIRWDFSATKHETTYVAVEGVEGTDDGFTFVREPRWGRIDGEGLVEDNLDSYCAWTELEDDGAGGFVVKEDGMIGTVAGVNGEEFTDNPARSDNDKRAIPVGMRVYLKPGTPYLDGTTGKIFDHWRFTTDDLLQLTRPQLTGERNSLGHYGAVIRAWHPGIADFVDSQLIWLKILDQNNG